MNVCKNEGCNASKDMSSANEGERRRSALIEIEKQWSERSHKRLSIVNVNFIHEGSKTSALSCSLKDTEFL